MLTQYNESPWRILLRRVLLIVALALLLLATVFTLSVNTKRTVHNNPIPLSANAMAIKKSTINIGLPIRLKIPIINIDAAIAYVGLNSDGAMDIKKDPTQVAWYQLGPRPGENGSAVIAGHYGWADGKGSVFNNLHSLNKGDKLSIIDNKGVSVIFVVRESRKYDPDADASSVFESSDGKSHLNLVTCNGTWINSKNTYSERLVVFTDKKVGT